MSARPARLALATLTCTAAAVLTTLGTAPAGAMAGGADVRSTREAPWMATLTVRGDGPVLDRTSCGGTLVAPDRVLTAAHCFDGVDPAALPGLAEYRIGATTLSTHPGQRVGIAAIAVDPEFRELSSPAAPNDPEADSATHDLAVITLDHPVRGVQALPLARRTPRVGAVGALYGHGITAPGSGTSDVLRRGLFRTGDPAACARSTPAAVDTAAMLCGRGRATACTGDSGGPLVVWQDGRRRLAGVFSFGMETAGKPCGTPGPDFFSSVVASADWLRTVLHDRPRAH